MFQNKFHMAERKVSMDSIVKGYWNIKRENLGSMPLTEHSCSLKLPSRLEID
jgi:hypothetical protein